MGDYNFDLADSILSMIPTDPYEQLDLARKITSMAISSRVSNLECQLETFKKTVSEKDRIIHELKHKLQNAEIKLTDADDRFTYMSDHNDHIIGELKNKVEKAEIAFRDAGDRFRYMSDDNMKLSKERDSLAITAKKMSRDLQKLETFKKQLMQSLNDDNISTAETVDVACDQSDNNSYPTKDEANNHTSYYSSSTAESGYTSEDASRQGSQRFSITPYITPRLSPLGTPRIMSKPVTPIRHSGVTSPIKSQYGDQSSVSSWYSCSQQSSAANSPPHGRPIPARPPRIDGKEFFRQSRSRLSYEQFSAFLANVKEFNSQKQSREETLRKAEEIFGTDNRDLYLSFQGLLNRNVN